VLEEDRLKYLLSVYRRMELQHVANRITEILYSRDRAIWSIWLSTSLTTGHQDDDDEIVS